VREKNRAADSDIGRLAFPSFLHPSTCGARTSAHHGDLERERRPADDLAAAFQDLKSFELAEEERLRRAVESETAPPRRGWTRWRSFAICASTPIGTLNQFRSPSVRCLAARQAL